VIAVQTANGSPRNASKKAISGKRSFREVLDDDEVPVSNMMTLPHHLLIPETLIQPEQLSFHSPLKVAGTPHLDLALPLQLRSPSW